MECEYLICSKCKWENHIDPACEVPPELYTCDDCGHPLRDAQRAVHEPQQSA